MKQIVPDTMAAIVIIGCGGGEKAVMAKNPACALPVGALQTQPES